MIEMIKTIIATIIGTVIGALVVLYIQPKIKLNFEFFFGICVGFLILICIINKLKKKWIIPRKEYKNTRNKIISKTKEYEIMYVNLQNYFNKELKINIPIDDKLQKLFKVYDENIYDKIETLKKIKSMALDSSKLQEQMYDIQEILYKVNNILKIEQKDILDKKRTENEMHKELHKAKIGKLNVIDDILGENDLNKRIDELFKKYNSSKDELTNAIDDMYNVATEHIKKIEFWSIEKIIDPLYKFIEIAKKINIYFHKLLKMYLLDNVNEIKEIYKELMNIDENIKFQIMNDMFRNIEKCVIEKLDTVDVFQKLINTKGEELNIEVEELEKLKTVIYELKEEINTTIERKQNNQQKTLIIGDLMEYDALYDENRLLQDIDNKIIQLVKNKLFIEYFYLLGKQLEIEIERQKVQIEILNIELNMLNIAKDFTDTCKSELNLFLTTTWFMKKKKYKTLVPYLNSIYNIQNNIVESEMKNTIENIMKFIEIVNLLNIK